MTTGTGVSGSWAGRLLAALEEGAMLSLILILAAVILFGIAAIGVAGGRVNLVAAGLFCLALDRLISTAHLGGLP